MAVAELSEAEKHKSAWLEAKALASERGKALDDASKALKVAQDAVVAAEEKSAAAEAVKVELDECKAALVAANAENADLAKKLAKVSKQVGAAQKIAEGLAELG